MRRIIGIVILSLIVILGSILILSKEGRAGVSVEVNLFYQSLAPYGNWVQLSGYGYVWYPHAVQVDWRPYTYGHWVWTTHGWKWRSYWRWGWAPFHYGRWKWTRRYGWVWIPGGVWAPAWVVWYTTDEYIAWTPMGPYWSSGYYPEEPQRWIVVPVHGFFSIQLHRVILPPQRVKVIFKIRHPRHRHHFGYLPHKGDEDGLRDRNVYRKGPDIRWIRAKISSKKPQGGISSGRYEKHEKKVKEKKIFKNTRYLISSRYYASPNTALNDNSQIYPKSATSKLTLHKRRYNIQKEHKIVTQKRVLEASGGSIPTKSVRRKPSHQVRQDLRLNVKDHEGRSRKASFHRRPVCRKNIKGQHLRIRDRVRKGFSFRDPLGGSMDEGRFGEVGRGKEHMGKIRYGRGVVQQR